MTADAGADATTKRRRDAKPVAYLIARTSSADNLNVLGRFDNLKEAHKALRSGAFTGEGLMLLALKRTFKSVEVVQRPRTVIQ